MDKLHVPPHSKTTLIINKIHVRLPQGSKNTHFLKGQYRRGGNELWSQGKDIPSFSYGEGLHAY